MARRNNTHRKSRGDGGWLAWGVAGLIMMMNLPTMMSLSQWIFDTFLEEQFWEFEIIKFPVFILCMIVGFFGLSAILMLGSKLLLLRLLPLITGGHRHGDA